MFGFLFISIVETQSIVREIDLLAKANHDTIAQ